MADEKKETAQSQSPSGPSSPQGAAPIPDENKAAKPAEGHAAAPMPSGPASQPWDSEMVTRLKRRHGSGIADAATYLGQNYLVIESSVAHDVLRMMRDDEQFNYCVDVTCVHWPQREKPFDVVWILYSFARNERVRVKAHIADGASAPSVTDLWETANWLEREAFDMFGVKFEGHPDMRRILLPEDWKGYPLRKDYGIIQQDKEWVQIHLGIESGQ